MDSRESVINIHIKRLAKKRISVLLKMLNYYLNAGVLNMDLLYIGVSITLEHNLL